MSISALWAFIRLSRPHFLLGGLLMHAVGTATANDVDAVRFLVVQVMVTAAQITAHFVNEYADVDADRLVENRTLFSGGSGVLADELLRPGLALRSAAVSTAVALGAAIAVTGFSLAAAAIGLVAVAVSWSYSMPPLRLAVSGLGEVTATAVVAGAVPLVGSLAQGGATPASLWWSIAVLLPIHFAMMLSFEIPDVESDAAAGKRVLAVRVGRHRTGVLMGSSLVLAGVAAAVGGAIGGLPVAAALATLAGMVPASLMALGLRRNRYGLLTGAGVATLVVVGVGLVLGLQL